MLPDEEGMRGIEFGDTVIGVVAHAISKTAGIIDHKNFRGPVTVRNFLS
jgi:hypothetical protein